MPSFSFFQQVLHNINTLFAKYLHIGHHLQAISISDFDVQRLKFAEKYTNLVEIYKKKFNPMEFVKFFFKSARQGIH